MWVGCYELFILSFLEVILNCFLKDLFKGYLQGSALNLSRENSGGTCSPFLGLRILYVLYEKV